MCLPSARDAPGLRQKAQLPPPGRAALPQAVLPGPSKELAEARGAYLD